MSDDRRRHPRITLSVDVDIASGSNFYAGKLRDLSVGGLFVELPMTPEVGTDVEISLSLGQHRFTLAARCAWVLTATGGAAVGFGAEFVTLAPRVKRAIVKFMKRREPLAFDLLDEVEDDPDADDAEADGTETGGGGPPPLPGP